MNIEIELKYQILEESKVHDFVKNLHLLGVKRVVDCYLDTEDASLFKKGIYIRVRDNKKIDIKFNRACLNDPNLELQSYCEEHSFNVPFTNESIIEINSLHHSLDLASISHHDLDNYRYANNLIEHRIVDKIRTSYLVDDFTIVLDDVVGLGKFLEIEFMAFNLENFDFIKAEMQKLLQGLHLKPLLTGYDALILRQQNFKQYIRGRFALKEDFESAI